MSVEKSSSDGKQDETDESVPAAGVPEVLGSFHDERRRCDYGINIMAGQPTPPSRTPLRNKGLIFGLIKGNQMVNKP